MQQETIQEIFTDQIDDPAVAMRGELDRNKLFELADNIKQNGLINPITVRPKNDRYEVVAGHRRLSACKIAGKIKIACVVRELDDQQTFEIMAAENLERDDVNPVEEAIFLHNFMERTGKSVAETAKAVRRSVAWVNSRLVVGEMPDYMQEFLKVGEVSLGVAVELMKITDDGTRSAWTKMAVRDGVSVAQAEYWVHGWQMSLLPGGERAEIPPGDFVPAVSEPIKFACAVDGNKYLPEDMRTVMVYKENLAYLENVLAEMRKVPEAPAA